MVPRNRYYRRATTEVCEWKTQITPQPRNPWSFTIIMPEQIALSSLSFNSNREILNSNSITRWVEGWPLCRVSKISTWLHWRYLNNYNNSTSQVYIPVYRGTRWSTSPRLVKCWTARVRAYYSCSSLFCPKRRAARRGSVGKVLRVSFHPSVIQHSPNSNYIRALKLLRRALGSSGFNHRKKSVNTQRPGSPWARSLKASQTLEIHHLPVDSPTWQLAHQPLWLRKFCIPFLV